MSIPSICFKTSLSIATENKKDTKEMIPKRPVKGCPSGTFNGLDTCFCEDHCSWEACWLIDPPSNCLSRIDGEMVWAWNDIKNAWVAQGIIK